MGIIDTVPKSVRCPAVYCPERIGLGGTCEVCSSNKNVIFEELKRMYRLEVWDNDGTQYLPLIGYGGQVEAYAPAHEALDIVEVAE